jgi:hypothetical protein
MRDLTILYYTANRLPEAAAARIRSRIYDPYDMPGWNNYYMVSVSQKPIEFGYNICVGDIGANKYNAYWQLYVGALAVTTEFVATVDDDTLYCPEHFEHRPPAGEFWYETNCWFAQDGKDHYWRTAEINKRGGMWGCIARTETLRANLAARFERYPNPAAPLPPWWGEPGVRQGDRLYGRRDRMARIHSARPCVIFIHAASMGYQQFSRWHRRYGQPDPANVAEHLDGYGTVADVRARYWSEAVMA